MVTVRNIFVMHQRGLELVAPKAVEAISDVMSAFPQYKDSFPITNLGDWQSPYAHFYQNGREGLRAYESVNWYLQRAKLRAMQDNRWQSRGQLHVGQMLQDLSHDPYFKKIPQWRIFLTSQDLYSHDGNGNILNFCLGCTNSLGIAVISTRRFCDRNNRFNVENFQTTVQHEFGHILNLTGGNHPHIEQALGSHCTDPACVMQQRMSGDVSDVTEQRLHLKAHGLPPICPDCIMQGYRTLHKESVARGRRCGPNGPNGPAGGR